MENEIAWQNKDITNKLFAEKLKEKSLRVYGLDIPKIIQVLPTNLPDIWANELKIDNLFLLEDGTLAIVDYESKYNEENKVKYLQYVSRVVERYRRDGKLKVKIRMIVIYTADVTPDEVSDEYDIGVLKMQIQSAYLSQINSEDVMQRLQKKVCAGEKLSDEEMMQFIILPLTYTGQERKRAAVKETIQLAKNIQGDTQSFILAGIIVFASKYADAELKNDVGGLLKMTFIDEYYQEKYREIISEIEKKHAEIEKKHAESEGKHAEAIIRDARKEKKSKRCIIEKLCLYLGITKEQAERYYEQVLRKQ